MLGNVREGRNSRLPLPRGPDRPPVPSHWAPMEPRPTPRVHQPRVSWFELFYDLVIVASIAHGSHLVVQDILNEDSFDFTMGTWLISTFVITFALWFSTTTAVNIAPGIVPFRKSLMFAQMFSVTVANLALSRSEGLPDDWGFAALTAAFASVACIFAITGRARPDLRVATGPWMWGSVAAAVLLAIGVVMPDEWVTAELCVFALAIVAGVLPIVLVGIPRMCRLEHMEPGHLSERIGQLVIIVIGESFLGLVLTLTGLNHVPGPVFFVATFLVAGSLWAIYFSSVFPLGLPLTPGRLELWLLGVMVFLVGVCYSAEILAAYAAVEWSKQWGSHSFIPLTAAYALAGALILSLIGGQIRDIAYARVHVVALIVLAVAWIALVAAGSPGNLLLLASSIVIIADGLACMALSRAEDRRTVASAA